MALRLFYAINFSSRTVSLIKERQDRLRRLIARGNWSRAENFHITLHFIGQAEEEELPLFREALEKAASSIAPFRLTFGHYGSFRQRTGDLIYLEVGDPDRGLERLSRTIRDELKRGDSRPLRPHVTLVRKARLPYHRLSELKRERAGIPQTSVYTAELMESRQEKGHPVYRSLQKVSLGGEPS